MNSPTFIDIQGLGSYAIETNNSIKDNTIEVGSIQKFKTFTLKIRKTIIKVTSNSTIHTWNCQMNQDTYDKLKLRTKP